MIRSDKLPSEQGVIYKKLCYNKTDIDRNLNTGGVLLKQDEIKELIVCEMIELGEKCCFPKGHIVVCQGDEMKDLYYINKGIVRGYYLDEEGNEVTKCFSAEKDLFCAEGFLYHRPASYYIECIEAVDCIRISYEKIFNWMEEDIKNTKLVNKLIIDAYAYMEERARALLMADARKRYESFLIQYASIAGRLKQKCIASYLGINEASLCRIKRKIDMGQ